MLAGKATLVLTIPRDFERSLIRSRAADVQLTVNAEKGSAAGIVQSYAAAIVTNYAAARNGPGGAAPLEIRTRMRYNAVRNY
jgi:ABC-2 type transport system permease protein